MRILGIDPGSRHCGWAVIERAGSQLRAIAWGRLSLATTADVPQRLRESADGLANLLASHQPGAAVVERVFHGPSTRSLVVLAEARGAILVELARAGLDVHELAPTAVKAAVAGSGRADKAQVAQMVRLQLGLAAASMPADASDALAVALAGSQLVGAARARRLPAAMS